MPDLTYFRRRVLPGVRVKREDDANGRWNYEVVVRSQEKEWGFEVDPNGKLLKTHGEVKK
jgi:uncharacterized membrane protein YkoI